MSRNKQFDRQAAWDFIEREAVHDKDIDGTPMRLLL
jgi:hypothetical protein